MADGDTHNFSSSSSHRLPTVSATQALLDVATSAKQAVPTGLESLDCIFRDRESGDTILSQGTGGLPRGEITEIYGPPGIGKTTFALQLAANVLSTGDSVIWVDSAERLNGVRLMDILGALQSHTSSQTTNIAQSENENLLNSIDKLHHFTTPTISHLLAIFTDFDRSLAIKDVGLLVVDNVSNLIQLAFSGRSEWAKDRYAGAHNNAAAQWASSRRVALLDTVLSMLERIAATNNITVILTSHTTTKIRDGSRAILYPAIASALWESRIPNRILLYRDWLTGLSDLSNQEKLQLGARMAGVIRLKGMSVSGLGKVTNFRIEQDGLKEINAELEDIPGHDTLVMPDLSRKRKYGEVEDSKLSDVEALSDHDFDWVDDDADLEDSRLLE